ncbi:DUF4054 domain-containing protein [Xenorhabdus khoisanae]|uniref:DUF4054 domain-containing protein n=1 Tax=Xenorhabdus khoisanae TaxID=880157 RepID=UPI0032B7A3DC
MAKNSLLPTVEQFRTDFPEFTDPTRYPDTAIQFYLGQADTLLNQDRHGDQFVYLTELFTAHYVELRGKAIAGAAVGGGVNSTNGGIVTSKSVDTRPVTTEHLKAAAEHGITGKFEAVQRELERAGMLASNGAKKVISDGDRLHPLSEQTKEKRINNGQGIKPLYDTGSLLKSITYIVRNKGE